MTIQDMGSLGEFVSAVAVLVTLVYLAIQTREARTAAEESAKFAAQEATRAAPAMYARFRSLVASPALAKVVVKARREALTEEEALQFSMMFEELIFAATTSYQSTLVGATTHGVEGDVHYVLSVLRENPLAVEVWRKQSPVVAQMSPEFLEAVNRGIESDV